MKYRLRKTQEIVDVIEYFAFNTTTKERGKDDWVSYIDSNGGEHHKEPNLNIWWDFEQIETPLPIINYPGDMVKYLNKGITTTGTPVVKDYYTIC
jgi:hypothetical protein